MSESKTEFHEYVHTENRWWIGRGLDLQKRSKATLHDDGTLWVGSETRTAAKLTPEETGELIRLLTDERVVRHLVYGNPVRQALEHMERDLFEVFEIQEHARKEMARR